MEQSNSNENLLSQVEARELLEPYLPALYEVFVRSWRTLEEIYESQPRLRTVIKARTRANLLSDLFTDNARALLGNMPGIGIKENRGCVMIDVRGRALIRFKKLDNKLRTRNIPTGQQRLIDEQSGQQVLFDTPLNATYLNAGYVLNLTATAFSSLFITCQKGKELLWPLELLESVADIVRIPVTAQGNAQPGFRIEGIGDEEAVANQADESQEGTATGT